MENELMVTVVIVTYGDRWIYVEKILIKLLSEQNFLISIVLVNNGVPYDLMSKIHEIGDIRIHVVNLGKNTGSAGGFYAGIYAAQNLGPQYIWLLDDDNLPEDSALRYLLLANALFGKNGKDCFVSYRPARQEYGALLRGGSNKPYRIDSFFGFHFLDFFRNFKTIVIRSSAVDNQSEKSFYPVVELRRAPYGGLLIPLGVIKDVGLPNKDFVLYMDDHEYSERIRRNGSIIYLVGSSIVNELEKSWDRSENKGHFFYTPGNNDFKLYYSIRNRVYLDLVTRVKNNNIYILNAVVYVFLSVIFHFLKNGRFKDIRMRYKLVKAAIFDGYNRKLGVNDKYGL